MNVGAKLSRCLQSAYRCTRPSTSRHCRGGKSTGGWRGQGKAFISKVVPLALQVRPVQAVASCCLALLLGGKREVLCSCWRNWKRNLSGENWILRQVEGTAEGGARPCVVLLSQVDSPNQDVSASRSSEDGPGSTGREWEAGGRAAARGPATQLVTPVGTSILLGMPGSLQSLLQGCPLPSGLETPASQLSRWRVCLHTNCHQSPGERCSLGNINSSISGTLCPRVGSGC